MTAMPNHKHWTAEAYLAYEETSNAKSEFLNDDVYMFAGASENHNLIALNTGTTLNNQLHDRPCRVYPSGMRVRVSFADAFVYPDMSVVCGERQIERYKGESSLNPTVVIEVLSPLTEMYDRGKKFQSYRALSSLQEYVLIAQDEPRVERFVRQDDNQWLLSDAVGLDAVVSLESIDCTLALADVYAKVDFEVVEDVDASAHTDEEGL